ncbi:serine/threonine-protein kinase [uncultured Jatrophihabitans sp.]|uniref:serine/threonine-protein kinase n=1 Tax=uncultured Jatrophihabitans sp. TaxID=1610747 RepID=UPI0035CCA7D5
MALIDRRSVAEDDLGDRFADVRTLHRGARFTVYEARDVTIRRTVAVKVPLRGGPRWLHEIIDHQANVLAPICTHPHIISLYQRLELDDGRPGLVLERCRGTLADALQGGRRLSARDVAAIGVKLAGALETTHNGDVVHCNVHPGNVLLSEWGEPVLSGYNEAVRIGAGQSGRPALQTTTSHTAPELLQGLEAQVQTDVYGLAATLYELVAGRGAFRAYAGESPAAIIVRVLSGSVRPIVDPEIPLTLSDLLTWAMSGQPNDRPPSPAWLAEELNRIEIEQGWTRTRLIG